MSERAWKRVKEAWRALDPGEAWRVLTGGWR